MNRILTSFSAALLATGAAAQCGTTAGGAAVTLMPTGNFPAADEGLSAPIPLGFGFPMGGMTYTHGQVESNGVIYLTNGAPATGTTQFGFADYMGTAGGAPRIAPFWDDLDDAVAPASWAVTVDQSSPGVFAVNWIDVSEYFGTTAKDFNAVLFSDGRVEFHYVQATMQCDDGDCTAGISVGGGITDPGSIDLSASPSTSSPIAYERWFTGLGDFDLAGTTLQFSPNVAGGYDVATTCSAGTPASHAELGEGCYSVSDSVYSVFGDAAAASVALTGQSLQLVRNGSSYDVLWGGGSFVPPVGAPLPLGDDTEIVVPLSAPFPTPDGPQSELRVHSNGLVSWGPAPQTFPGTSSFQPAAEGFLGATNSGVWSWHDYNVTEPGSGQVLFAEVGGVVYLTWDNVESFAAPEGPNPSTIQFQLDQQSGNIVVVWPIVDGNATSVFGSAHLVGWSPGGPSEDGGSVSLPAVTGYTVPSSNLWPLRLSASPAPISTPTAGTSVTYTLDDIPETSPGSGLYIGAAVFGLGAAPAPIPLQAIGISGAQGCFLYMQPSFVASVSLVGSSPSQGVSISIPPGLPSGLKLFAQAAAYAPGLNSAGVTTSNAVVSTIGAF